MKIWLACVVLFLTACSSSPHPQCDNESIVSVQTCGEFTKVTNTLGGSTFYGSGKPVNCPVVPPEDVSVDCTLAKQIACGPDVCEE